MIKQVPLYGSPAQRLMKLLPVNIEQQFAQQLQLLHRHDVAIDEGARASIRIDDPSQQAFTILIERVFFEPCAYVRHARYVKFCTKLGALCATSDKLAAAPCTEYETQCVDKDGFSSAGFACQYRHAGTEFDGNAVDDGEVPYLQAGQHRLVRALVTLTTVTSPIQFGAQYAEEIVAGRMYQL